MSQEMLSCSSLDSTGTPIMYSFVLFLCFLPTTCLTILHIKYHDVGFMVATQETNGSLTSCDHLLGNRKAWRRVEWWCIVYMSDISVSSYLTNIWIAALGKFTRPRKPGTRKKFTIQNTVVLSFQRGIILKTQLAGMHFKQNKPKVNARCKMKRFDVVKYVIVID